MQDLLNKIIAARSRERGLLDIARNERREIADQAGKEKRDRLSPAQQDRWDKVAAEIADHEARLAELAERESELREDIERDQTIARGAAKISGAIWRAGETSEDRYGELADLLRSGQPGRLELRAVTTANAGARTDVGSQTSAAPYVYQRARIKGTPAESLTFQSPYFAAPTALAATSEGGTKPVAADPTIKNVTLGAYANTISVSDQVARFGVGVSAIARRLESNVIFSVNAATVDAFEAEAGTPLAFAGSAGAMLDRGIATVQQRTGNYPSLIVVHPDDWATFTLKTGADSGDDIGSQVVSWNGTPIVANAAMTAGFAVVVDGAGWEAHLTGMIATAQPVLTNNTVTLLAEQYFALTPYYAGSAVAVDLVA